MSGAGNDFATEGADPSSITNAMPTRRDVVHAGFEVPDPSGEILFHAIVTDTCAIGRDGDCNLVIRGDSKVSRRHAVIERRGVDFVIKDAGSSNGTIVNGQKIEGEHALKVGDEVQIGLQKWKFARRAAV